MVMIFVMLFQKRVYLFRKETEKFFRRFSYHELSRNGNFAMGESKSGVAIEMDRTNSEIGPAKVNRQIQTL